MLRFLLCLTLLSWGGEAFAQTCKLSGIVADKANGAPIPGVNVVVKLNGALKGHYIYITDDKGFSLSYPLMPGCYKSRVY